MKQVFTILLFSFFCLAAFAQNGPKISIQGVLKDGNNIAVADGTYNMTFKLYTATGSTAEWFEIQNGINVTGGIYTVKLGATKDIPGDIFDEPLFLGVTVGGTELSPRVELTYAPYALSVAVAQEVACSGKVGDVKYSILAPTDFATENGDCWQLMDGSPLTSDSPLSANYGINILPDARGYFLRAHDNRASGRVDTDRTATTAPGTVQNDENKEHNHTAGDNSVNHSHTGIQEIVDWVGGTSAPQVDFQWERHGEPQNPAGVRSSTTNGVNALHTHSISNSGGSESRPTNMNFYLYIRTK